MTFLFTKKLGFEMTDLQREVVLLNFKNAIDEYIPKYANEKKGLYSLSSFSFSENYVLVPRALLKGLYRRACFACRVKKEGESYRFFSFEVMAPVLVENTAKCLKIKRPVNLDARPAIEKVKEIASLTEDELFGLDTKMWIDHIKVKEGGIGHTLGPPLLHQVHELMNNTLEKNDGREYALIHTHPHSTKGAADTLSDGDLYTMIHYEPVLTFLSCLCFEFRKFIYIFGSMAKELDASAFDKNGFLKTAHMKRIAEELASECVEDKALEEMYADAGMPLTVAHKTGTQIEVYTKLRIIG